MYARVSTVEQDNENQRLALEAWARREGVEDYDYIEEKLSSRKTRPKKQQMITDFRNGRYDTIVVARIDRYARSLQELVVEVKEIIDKGGRFVAIHNNFDFNKRNFDPQQQLIFHIFSAFAEFEKKIISERTKEGLARARAHVKKLGRPRKHEK